MEKKKVKLFSAIALVALALLVVGATYAYFQNQYGSASNADVKVTTYTTDVLTFETGSNISITAGQDDFASGKGNKTGQTFTRATLQANNKTNTATANYYMYLNIETNTFTYTNTGTPELLLQVINKTSGNPVTSITGLVYKTVTDGKNTSISGFDITNKKGLITILNNKEISASPKTIEEYTVTITLVNHSFDQNNNTGKNLNGKLLIQKEKMITSISDVAKNGDALAKALETLGIKGDSSLTGLYHHDATLANGAGDNSYRFAGADPNNYVCFGSDEATCPHENLYRIIGLIDGKIKLIHAYGATTTMLGTDEGYAKTYQAAFGRLSSYYKGNGDLAKIGSYKWNKTGTNTWSATTTNTTNLNKNFLAYLDGKNAKWKTMIADTTWYVGGMTSTNGYKSNAKTAYTYEVGTNKDATTVTSKIGLMYLSEYYYAASKDYWILPGYDQNGSWNSAYKGWLGNDYSKAYNNNWMSTGLNEWTISRYSDASDFAFGIAYDGGVGYVNVDFDLGRVVRPSFNLTSSVKYDSGDGTAVNPIQLKI